VLTQIIKEGEKNLSVLIKGMARADFEPAPILDVAKLKPPREGWKGLRLDSAVWAVQEKMGLYLWWGKPDGEGSLVMPMESRNSVRFDEGIPSPRIESGWKGILYLSSFNCQMVPKGFFVLLDFDKQ
jgi:hypothetical protein